MRYMPPQIGGSYGYGDGTARFTCRPPLDRLPKELANLLLERDHVTGTHRDALTHSHDLEGNGLDLAAHRADAEAAAVAARAGKPIPGATAVTKLADDRAEATRAVAAHAAALELVTQACAEQVDVVRDQRAETAPAERAKARAEIEALADKLSTAVEAAVQADAVRSWLSEGRHYSPDVRTWIVDAVPDMARHGLNHQNSALYSAREIITGTALTVLEEN
jgi:hypothetical protein